MAESSPPEPAAKKAITNSLDMKLVLIPAGRFVMGTPKGEKARRPYEGPQHTVHITSWFFMGAHEVTQAEFEKILGTNPSHFKKVEGQDTSRFPADNVTYDEAVKFCQKLSELPAEKEAGREYRLPTEAEWEYACRAGSTTAFTLGPKLSSTQANFNGWHPYGGADQGPYLQRTTTVGSYKPNAFGLYDMHGNVYEWVTDFYDNGYYAKSPTEDPRGPPSGKHHGLRGGSWRNVASFLRSGERYFDRADRRHEDHGFRVVAVVSASITAPQ
jgi:formylglycine-generating enzyme required for sulfatase activity